MLHLLTLQGQCQACYCQTYPHLNCVLLCNDLLDIPIALQLCNILGAAQEQRQPLVQLPRLNVQDAPLPI